MEKSLHQFTYQLDHDELVDPSDKMHLSYGVLVGAVVLNVGVVVVDKAVDNGTVVHIRVAVALLVDQTMTTGYPFVRHAFDLIKHYNIEKNLKKRREMKETKLTKHERDLENVRVCDEKYSPLSLPGGSIHESALNGV